MANQLTKTLPQTHSELSAEMLELVTGKRTVVWCISGNSSFIGQIASTVTHTYQIIEPNGKVYSYDMGVYTDHNGNPEYKTPFYKGTRKQQIKEAVEISWEEVPQELKLRHYQWGLELVPVFLAFDKVKYDPKDNRDKLEFLVYSYGVEKGVSIYEKILREIFVYENHFSKDNCLTEVVYERFGKWENYIREYVADRHELIKFDNGGVILFDKFKKYDKILFLGTDKEFQNKFSEVLTRAEIAQVPFEIAYITRNIESRTLAMSWIERLEDLKMNLKAKGLNRSDFYPKTKNPKLKTVLGHQIISAVKGTYNDSYDVIVNYLLG